MADRKKALINDHSEKLTDLPVLRLANRSISHSRILFAQLVRSSNWHELSIVRTAVVLEMVHLLQEIRDDCLTREINDS